MFEQTKEKYICYAYLSVDKGCVAIKIKYQRFISNTLSDIKHGISSKGF